MLTDPFHQFHIAVTYFGYEAVEAGDKFDLQIILLSENSGVSGGAEAHEVTDVCTKIIGQGPRPELLHSDGGGDRFLTAYPVG